MLVTVMVRSRFMDLSISASQRWRRFCFLTSASCRLPTSDLYLAGTCGWCVIALGNRLGRVRIVLELPVVIGRVGHHTGTGTASRVQVTESLVARADNLAWEHGLRAYDAVHLAAALIWQAALGEPVTVATFDKQLWQAARAIGLAIWPQLLE